MVRGIKRPFKQLVYYQFNENMNRSKMDKIIMNIQRVGGLVRGVVHDMGNHGWIKECKILKGKHYFMNPDPRYPDHRIFCFADVPHCLKNFR